LRLRLYSAEIREEFSKESERKEDKGMGFVLAAKKSDVPPGTIRELQVEGKAVALANVAGQFHAIDGICLHRGGPLGDGVLEGNVVTCPWHGWEYDVTTGKVAQNPTAGVACYAVEVRGDDIFVSV
jgi:nitrite reductase/ring-hydroxylating ferredoxin subunit